MISKILEWIYPRRCLICHVVLNWCGNDFLCPGCRKKIPFLCGNLCGKCSRPLEGEVEDEQLCKYCSQSEYAFEKGYSAFSYQVMKYPIEHFKFHGYWKDAVGLASLMAQYCKENFYTEFLEHDFMVPVPIHASRYRKRGFNQAQLLAEQLESLTGLSCLCDVLIRIKDTDAQYKLTPKERKRNLKSAFQVSDSAKIEGKNILLIDDIYTTGATLNECAKVLKASGAKRVDFYTLSIVREEI